MPEFMDQKIQIIKPLMYEGKGLISLFFQRTQTVRQVLKLGRSTSKGGVNKQLKKGEMQLAKHMGK